MCAWYVCVYPCVPVCVHVCLCECLAKPPNAIPCSYFPFCHFSIILRISVGLVSRGGFLFSCIPIFHYLPLFLFSGSYNTARRMWKCSYSVTHAQCHNRCCQPAPGDRREGASGCRGKGGTCMGWGGKRLEWGSCGFWKRRGPWSPAWCSSRTQRPDPMPGEDSCFCLRNRGLSNWLLRSELVTLLFPETTCGPRLPSFCLWGVKIGCRPAFPKPAPSM